MKLYYVMNEIAEGFEDWYILDTGMGILEMFSKSEANFYNSMDEYKKSFDVYLDNLVITRVL